MGDLLFLCHRIPYPPDKGEKIRAWNLLRGLAQRYRVHLGAFVDDPEDWAGREALERICAEVKLLPLDRRLGKLRALAAIPLGQSLSVAFYRDRRMQRWVDEKLGQGMDGLFIYASTMAQYAPARRFPTPHPAPRGPSPTADGTGQGPPVGAVPDRDSARSALQTPEKGTPLRAVSRSETAPTDPDHPAEAPTPPVGGASPRRHRAQPDTEEDRGEDAPPTAPRPAEHPNGAVGGASPRRHRAQPGTEGDRGGDAEHPTGPVGGASPRRFPSPSPAQSPGESVLGDHPPIITDFVDVDSEKWRQYGEAGGALGWLYRLEARRLAAFERERATRADHTLLVTRSERECFLRSAPELAERVHAVPNGVDTEYFAQDQHHGDPFHGAQTLVFVGAMDYRPNVEAVTRFARDVFPRIRERAPGTQFCIVGLRPAPAVQALARQPGITVTGRVPDVRPYVAHAAAVVAPLTIARGVQNKVLEAMAMGRPVVCTPQALEGIAAKHREHLFVASGPAPLVEAVLALLQRPDRARAVGASAAAFVREHHGWPVSVNRIAALLKPGEAEAPSPYPSPTSGGRGERSGESATEAPDTPVGGASPRRHRAQPGPEGDRGEDAPPTGARTAEYHSYRVGGASPRRSPVSATRLTPGRSQQ